MVGHHDGHSLRLVDALTWEAHAPFDCAAVGTKPGLTPGHFDVLLRFADEDSLRQSVETITTHDEDGKCFVDIVVPMVADEEPEVQMRW